MNKEIANILDKFKNYTQYINSWKEKNKDYSMLEYKLNVNEMKIIEDYICTLQHQLEEKDEIINEAINFINMIKDETYQSSVEGICDTALEILERGKNGK